MYVKGGETCPDMFFRLIKGLMGRMIFELGHIK